MSVLGIHLYQCTSWWLWETVLAFSEFFRIPFQCIRLFHDRWFTSSLANTSLSMQQVLTQNGMNPMPYPPYTPDLDPRRLFVCLFSWTKGQKGPQKKMFSRWGRSKTKNAEAVKSIKMDQFENSWAVQKYLHRCIAPNGEYLEGYWSLNMWE